MKSITLAVALGSLMLASCSTPKTNWNYAMDSHSPAGGRHCTGKAAMDISSGRIDWETNALACKGDPKADILSSKGGRMVLDEERGWRVDAELPKYASCNVDMPTGAHDTGYGMLIHCEWDCRGDSCAGNAEYRLVPQD